MKFHKIYNHSRIKTLSNARQNLVRKYILRLAEVLKGKIKQIETSSKNYFYPINIKK
jgi:hypothetical protein